MKNKKEEQKNPKEQTAEEAKREQELLEEQKKSDETRTKIEKILKEDERGIQSYLVFTEFGIFPRSRIVPVNDDNDEEEKPE